MRHQQKGFKLGRSTPHRKATMAAMSNALIKHKRITTTLAKAKALRQHVEPIINRAKDDTTHNRRQVFRRLQDKHSVKELFGEIAEKVGERPGGYTRIVKLGRRAGDSAQMAVIELVDYNDIKPEGEGGTSRTRRTRRGGRKRGKAAAAATAAATSAATAVEQVVDEAAEKAADVAESAKETVVEAVEDTKEAVEDLAEAAKEKVEDVVEDVVEGAAKAVDTAEAAVADAVTDEVVDEEVDEAADESGDQDKPDDEGKKA